MTSAVIPFRPSRIGVHVNDGRVGGATFVIQALVPFTTYTSPFSTLWFSAQRRLNRLAVQ